MECQVGANFCTSGFGLTGFGLVTAAGSEFLGLVERGASNGLGLVGNLGLGTRDASGGFHSSSFGLIGSEFFQVEDFGVGTRDASGGFQLGLVGSEFFRVEDFGVGTRAESAGFQLSDLAPLEEMASLILDTT